jgi:hypothetical protein
MMPPTLPVEIGKVALAAVYVSHPELYEFDERLANEWWARLGRLITAPADDVDLVWACLVELSEILCDAPARPRQEA